MIDLVGPVHFLSVHAFPHPQDQPIGYIYIVTARAQPHLNVYLETHRKPSSPF